MERMAIPDSELMEIKLEFEQKTDKPVRNISGQRIIRGMQASLTDEDVKTVFEIAENIASLSDEKMLYPLFVVEYQDEKKKEMLDDPRNHAHDVWGRVAQNEILAALAKWTKEGKHITGEAFANLTTVPEAFLVYGFGEWWKEERKIEPEAFVEKDESFNPENSPHTYDVLAYCPAPQLARQWFATAIKVFRRADKNGIFMCET